ncbi:hypothetical protein HDE_13749 [Halotydeus destructor]|nr:hypothetical protein HDE_13749 [Halotydeus destructor]
MDIMTKPFCWLKSLTETGFKLSFLNNNTFYNYQSVHIHAGTKQEPDTQDDAIHSFSNNVFIINSPSARVGSSINRSVHIYAGTKQEATKLASPDSQAGVAARENKRHRGPARRRGPIRRRGQSRRRGQGRRRSPGRGRGSVHRRRRVGRHAVIGSPRR